MKHKICPNCNSSRFEDFYSVKNAPTQSVVTIKTFEDAIAIPRKDIDLAFCHECGFIFNSSFDTSIDYYTGGYEDQQGFSPTFTKFISGVTNRFIDKYNIRNKDIIEIGCGKGDFLSLICKLADSNGIGIDPAYVEGRQKPNPKVKFLKEFYSVNHADLPKDVITCRHTLEHIHATNEFIGTIRKSITKESDSILFFEVPCIVRILDIQAFWDIFYEHCTYLSPGSLGRLFRNNGFEVLDMYLEYDDQYLFIEAKPADVPSTVTHKLEESVEALWGMAQKFVVKVNETLGEWKKLLTQFKEQNKKVVVWGGGSKAVGFLTHMFDIGVIKHVVDINPHITGNYIPGIGIQYKNPEFIKEYQPDVVIIMNGIYKNEITKSLHDMGVHPEVYAL